MSDNLFAWKFRTASLPLSLSSLALLVSLGCGSDDPTPPSGDGGTIHGTVTANGTGVLNAEIVLSGAASRTTTTNGVGAYSFADLPDGDYTVSISLPAGYELSEGESVTRDVTIAAGGTATVSWTTASDLVVQVVQLEAESFVPPTVTISPGTTVRWVVQEGSHTITPNDGNQAGGWSDTGGVSPGDVFEHTFTESGESYEYHCTLHLSQGMTGTVIVQ